MSVLASNALFNYTTYQPSKNAISHCDYAHSVVFLKTREDEEPMAEEATKDFFISYNKADRGWAEWIAWQLEAEGYSTIIQAWDFRPASNFILEMDHATTVATRTIAVLSPDYLDALYTKPEWAEAFRQDPTGKDGKLLPVRVRTCTLKGLLSAIGYIDLVGRNNALAAQNALLAGVRRSRAIPSTAPIFPGDASAQPSSQPPAFPGNWPLVWNVPYRRNPFFTGREALLTSLHEQLTGKKAVALTQTLAIHGLGGIGKTQTAVEYAYRYQQEYQAVLWVRAAARDTFVSDYKTIAVLLHLVEKEEKDQARTVQVVKQWLTGKNSWLLILDNADELEVIPDFLPTGEKGHLLLTTRDPSVEGMVRSIEVEQMDMEEGVELLLRRAGGLASDIPIEQVGRDNQVAAERIVQEMGGLPLAIDQAGAYIEQTRCGLARYMELYQQHRTELLKWKRRVPSNYPQTVSTTWALAFEQVEQCNPAAADLLRLCAFLDPDSIPEDFLKRGASELGPVLQPLVEDTFAFNEAIDVLRSFSLIRRLVDTQSMAIHRLVKVVLKDRMDYGTQQQWAERTVRLVIAAFPQVEFETWEQCRRYQPQVYVCLDLINQYGIHIAEAASQLRRAGWYLNDRTRNAEAEPLLWQVLAIHEEMLGTEHLSTAATLNNLGELYYAQGRYGEAESLLQQALTIREQTLGKKHPETATTQGTLGKLYCTQGRYGEAEPLLQQALTICEQTLGKKHPETATTLDNLGELSQAQGRYQEAEALYQRALAIREKTLGPEHPETGITLYNLVVLYKQQGRYQEAEALIQRSVAIDEQCFGPEHLEVAVDLEDYVDLLERMQRTEEAAQLKARVQAIRAKQQP